MVVGDERYLGVSIRAPNFQVELLGSTIWSSVAEICESVTSGVHRKPAPPVKFIESVKYGKIVVVK